MARSIPEGYLSWVEWGLEGGEAIYRNITMPMVHALQAIEHNGVLIDKVKLQLLDEQYRDKISEAEQGFWDLAGDQVNYNSPMKLREFLYDELELPILLTTKSGFPSTALPALAKLKDEHEVVGHLYELKKLVKIKRDFLGGWGKSRGLIQWIQDDGRIHTSYRVDGTESGRLSTGDPNTQNIAKVEEIRSMFIPRDGYVFGEADYCVAPNTRILTQDLRWVTAASLQEGDALIGFDEEVQGQGHGGSKFRPTTVLRNVTIRRPCYEIVTDHGTIVVSEDHKFVGKEPRATYFKPRQWHRAKDLKPGWQLSFYVEPWDVQEGTAAGYIAGFFDGEGYCSKNGPDSGNVVGWAQNDGPVAAYVCDLLRQFGFDNTSHPQKGPSGHLTKYYLKGRGANIRFLGMFRPVRLLPQGRRMWDGRRTWGKTGSPATVLEVNYIGEQEVCAIETSTKTYISEGFLSHNCQLELNIAAKLSGDERMAEAIALGMHEMTASFMFNVPVEQVTEKQRSTAKTINFLVLYGGGAYTLAFRLNITEEEAEAYLRAWQRAYKRVVHWLKVTQWEATKKGYVDSIWGRRRHLPELKTPNRADPNWKRTRSHLLRVAVNFPIQSAGSDALSMSTIQMLLDPHEDLLKMGVKFTMTLHDALFFEVPERHAIEAGYHIQNVMSTVPKLMLGSDWALGSDVKLGRYWGDKSVAELKAA